jgi:hypothetical protein
MAVPLFADGAVNGLARQIGLRRVPRGLLDEGSSTQRRVKGLPSVRASTESWVQAVG